MNSAVIVWLVFLNIQSEFEYKVTEAELIVLCFEMLICGELFLLVPVSLGERPDDGVR